MNVNNEKPWVIRSDELGHPAYYEGDGWYGSFGNWVKKADAQRYGSAALAERKMLRLRDAGVLCYVEDTRS